MICHPGLETGGYSPKVEQNVKIMNSSIFGLNEVLPNGRAGLRPGLRSPRAALAGASPGPTIGNTFHSETLSQKGWLST